MDNKRVPMTLELDQPVADGTTVIEEQPRSLVLEQNEPSDEPVISTPAATPVEGVITKKRRDSKVRFLSGDQLTRVVELGSPWDNAPTSSTDETLAAYRRCCSEHKMKPLSRVLKQLESIQNFKERALCLDLKGLRLDNRTCEALEAVFKRLQFVTVNLEGTAMEDDGAMAIFEMMDFYESANRLIVSHNGKLGCRAWIACSKMMKKSPCLEYLDVRNNTFDEYTIPLIGRPIRANCLLKTLHVEGCQMTGRVHLIMVAALKTNTHLTDLFLGNNRLVADDMIHLGNVLKLNNTLQLLDIRDNNIQDDGVRFIFEGLLEQQRGLSNLVLWNNRITPQGMHAVAAVLPFHETLETLNLGCNRIESQGCQILKPGLLASKTLLRLGLVNCRVTCEGAIALAEVVGDNAILERLDVRDNDIRVAGLMALALAHRVSHHLIRLDIKRNIRVEQRDAELVKKLFEDIDRYSQRNKMEHEEREARKAVLKRQQELENQKKMEEEQEEAERRAEALEALSTALHAQALAKGQGLLTIPVLNEGGEDINGDIDCDMDLLLDRPHPVGEELETKEEEEAEEADVVEAKEEESSKEEREVEEEGENEENEEEGKEAGGMNMNAVKQAEEVMSYEDLETETSCSQLESVGLETANHLDDSSLSNELSLYNQTGGAANNDNLEFESGDMPASIEEIVDLLPKVEVDDDDQSNS